MNDLTKLKGVGNKTLKIFKKKKLITYLIYFGGCHDHSPTGQY